MLIDEFEPQDIEAVITQSLPGSMRSPLNRNRFADYLWYDYASKPEQAERKHADEILAKIGDTEYQLGSEVAEYLGIVKPDDAVFVLIVEDPVEPIPTGLQTFTLAKNGRYFRPQRKYTGQSGSMYARFEGWLVALERFGIIVWRTSSWIGTAHALIRWAKSAEHEKTSILQRHMKLKPAFHPNPHVQTLMGIRMPKGKKGFGPELAEAAVDTFGSAWGVLSASPEVLAENLDGMGVAWARDILQAVGRKV